MLFLKSLPTREMLEHTARRYPGLEPDLMAEGLERLRWASVLMRDLGKLFAQHGLTQTQYLILIVIEREPDRDCLTPSEIAERLDVSRPIATNAIKRLRAAGRLEQETGEAEADGRIKLIRLTDAGRETLRALMPEYFRLVQRRVAELRAAEGRA